jgi:hypothetical protein
MNKAQGGGKMIESSTNSSLSAANYLVSSSKTASYSHTFSTQEVIQSNTSGGDQVSLSYRFEAYATYTESKAVQSLAKDGYELLRSMVQKVFHEQGLDTTFSAGDDNIDLESLSLEKAQELVAEDGYFGIEKTSERIFQFAKGIAGGDPARIDAIREGVDKGFQEALDAFGGWLPDISYDTYDAVMQKLNDWVEGFDQ